MRFSFIIPAYNAEAFLERCLDSIASQGFLDYEIVIIDDGSADKTGAVAARRMQQDARIRVHTQLNSGQGAARSVGIGLARGDWIWFVDSDDWLLPHVLQRIAGILERHDPDVLVVNFEYATDGQPAQPSSLVPPQHAGRFVDMSQQQTFATFSCWNTPPWRLISRRSLLLQHDIRFARGYFYEDHPFAIQLMLQARKVFVDAPVSYAYYQRQGSVTHVNDKKALDFIPIRRMCLELLKAHGVYEKFADISAGYLAPLNFYRAHVAAPFQQTFFDMLDKDLTPQEEAFARAQRNPDVDRFLDAVRRHQPDLIPSVPARPTLIRRLLRARAWSRIRQRIKASPRFRAMRAALHSATGHVIDPQGHRFLTTGPGTRIEHMAIYVRVAPEDRPYVLVGSDSHIGGQFVFERGLGEIRIGNRTSIGGGCLLICSQSEGIRVGNNVMLSWNVTATDTDAHSLDPAIRHNDAYDWKCGLDAGRPGAYKDWTAVDSRPLVIEDDAWIGFGAAILKGVRIGRGAVIGAHAVVTNDVPPYTVFAGNPARFVRLVPRQHWSWEDIVHAMQADPAQQGLLIDSYLHRDLSANLQRYRLSPEYRELLELVRSSYPHARRVLDVGAGNGIVAVNLALEGLEVTAVEPSGDAIVGAEGIRRMARIARGIDASIDERVSVFHGFVEQFESPVKFDMAVCRQVTHHFPDPESTLRHIRRLLQPGGVALLVREHVVFDDDDKQRFLDSHPMQRYYGGENAFTVQQYTRFAMDAGFAVTRVIPFKENVINFYPHAPESIRDCDEMEHAGRPYTFVLTSVEQTP